MATENWKGINVISLVRQHESGSLIGVIIIMQMKIRMAALRYKELLNYQKLSYFSLYTTSWHKKE